MNEIWADAELLELTRQGAEVWRVIANTKELYEVPPRQNNEGENMEEEKMSDLEFGRAWAKMMGIPLHGRSYRGATQHNGADKAWHWRRAETPKILHNEMRFCSCCAVSICDFDTESEAYAALGKAVRAVHAAVPPLPPADAGDAERKARGHFKGRGSGGTEAFMAMKGEDMAIEDAGDVERIYLD